jgi:hypothetical protein
MITNKIAEIATLNRKKCPESGEFLKDRGDRTVLGAARSAWSERLDGPGKAIVPKPVEGRHNGESDSNQSPYGMPGARVRGQGQRPVQEVCLFAAWSVCKIKLTRHLGHPTGPPNTPRLDLRWPQWPQPRGRPRVAMSHSGELSRQLGQLTGISRAVCQPQAEKDSDGATTRHKTPRPQPHPRPAAAGSIVRINCRDSPGYWRRPFAGPTRGAAAIATVSRTRGDAAGRRAHPTR